MFSTHFPAIPPPVLRRMRLAEVLAHLRWLDEVLAHQQQQP